MTMVFYYSYLRIIVSVYEMEHNFQTSFFHLVSWGPDMNPARHLGFISLIQEVVFNDTPMAPRLFFLATFLSGIIGFLSESI